MTQTLKNKAVSASIWSAIDIFARQGVQFIITLILARLLTPTDYGTVGLLSIFIGLAGVFINAGFTSALIQRKEINDVDLSSVFYFNIGISFFLSVLLCVLAPWIAVFYGLPVLTPLTRLLALSLFIGAFGTVQTTLMTKSLDFRKQCIVSLTSVVSSGTIAIYLAFHNYGVWSLVLSNLFATFATTCLLWFINSWRPHFVFSITAIRSLFKFGSFILVSNLSDMLYTRLNTLVIGKFYSPKDLGFYSRADGTQQLPATLLTGVINRVAFPIFSSIHQEKNHLQSGLRKAIGLVMLVNIPVMLGLAITSKLVVLVLFGDKWLPCVPYLRILCLGGLLWPIHVLNLNILVAQGHSNLFFKLEVIKKIIGITFLCIACFFGIIAMAWSIVLTSVIGFGINTHYSGLFLGYGSLRQITDLIPYFLAGLVMAVCVWGAGLLSIHIPFVLLTIQVFTGGIVYFIFCYFLKLAAFTEALNILGSRFQDKFPFGPK